MHKQLCEMQTKNRRRKNAILYICTIQPSLLSAKRNEMNNTSNPIKSTYDQRHLHICLQATNTLHIVF